MSTRRVSALLVAALLALSTTGCGAGSQQKKLTIPEIGSSPSPGATGSPSGSASPSATATSASATTFDDQGDDAIRGTVAASTPDEEAVADAWMAYWVVRTRSYFHATVDPQLGTVAGADAVAQVVEYVTYLRSKHLHTVGDTRFGVSGITIRGRTATLSSCGVNKSVDRKANGAPAEALVPFYDFRGQLTKVAGTWRVVEVSLDGTDPCDA